MPDNLENAVSLSDGIDSTLVYPSWIRPYLSYMYIMRKANFHQLKNIINFFQADQYSSMSEDNRGSCSIQSVVLQQFPNQHEDRNKLLL